MKKAIITKAIIGMIWIAVFTIGEFAEIGIAHVMNYHYHGMEYLEYITHYYQTSSWAWPGTIFFMIASTVFVVEFVYRDFFTKETK